MQKTVKDLKQMAGKTYDYSKLAIYYGFLPAVILLGLKTVHWDRFNQSM